jgi:Spy/CpxP family protein refolding chaperone
MTPPADGQMHPMPPASHDMQQPAVDTSSTSTLTPEQQQARVQALRKKLHNLTPEQRQQLEESISKLPADQQQQLRTQMHELMKESGLIKQPGEATTATQ